MNDAAAMRPAAPLAVRRAGLTLALIALAAAGYLGLSDLRVAAAVVTSAALAAWYGIACRYPPFVLSVSFLLILAAGTKFRLRDATASLDAVMDVQILFELALFAAVGVAVLATVMASAGAVRSAGLSRPRSGRDPTLAEPDERRKFTGVELLIGAYVGMALLSVLWSVAPVLTLVRAVQLVIVAGVAIVAVRTLTPSVALWTASRAVAAYAISCAALAAAFPWASGTMYEGERVRFAWFSVHPIAAGTLAAIAALGLLSAVVWPPPVRRSWSPGVRRIGYLVPALLLIVTLVLTNSRGPLLAFAAGFVTLVFMRLPSGMRLPLVLVTAAVGLAVMAAGPGLETWLLSAATYDSAMSRLFLQGQSADAVMGLSGRIELWTDVQPTMAEQALLGHGYQASRSVLLEVASWAGYAHNALLQTILDLGVAGAIGLFAIVVAGLAAAFRRDLTTWARGALAALMVFLALNSISTESFAGAPGFEMLLLFVCALCAASQPSAFYPEATR